MWYQNLVSKAEKRLEAIRNNPRDVRLSDLRSTLEAHGFEKVGGSGGHEVYAQEGIEDIVNLQPDKKNKGKAKAYQVRQVLQIIDENDLKLE